MDQIGQLLSDGRAEVFREAGNRLGIASPVILEKDYWVCWSLSKLFEPELLEGLVFKGGTSLSKAYALIRRFSEDVDLTIPLSALGIAAPVVGISRKARIREFEQAKGRCAEVLKGQIRESLLTRAMEAGIQGMDIVVDAGDPLTLILQYPPSLLDREYGASNYIQPSVRLEFGIRGGVEPSSFLEVESYCTQAIPDIFGSPKVPVRVLGAERTLWEKATICHATYHGAPNRWLDQISRHYSDLGTLARSEVAKVALAQPGLLVTVVENTLVNFPVAWARYEEATLARIRIVPHSELAARLREDYGRMSVMFFDPPPAFDAVMETLESFEARIRAL